MAGIRIDYFERKAAESRLLLDLDNQGRRLGAIRQQRHSADNCDEEAFKIEASVIEALAVHATFATPEKVARLRGRINSLRERADGLRLASDIALAQEIELAASLEPQVRWVELGWASVAYRERLTELRELKEK